VCQGGAYLFDTSSIPDNGIVTSWTPYFTYDLTSGGDSMYLVKPSGGAIGAIGTEDWDEMMLGSTITGALALAGVTYYDSLDSSSIVGIDMSAINLTSARDWFPSLALT